MGRKIQNVTELYEELFLLRKRHLESGRNATRKSRSNKKKKNSIPKPKLRPVCRLSNVSNVISSKLDRLVPMNTQTRIEKVKAMFQTVVMYPSNAEGLFIIQCLHEDTCINWLEIKKRRS